MPENPQTNQFYQAPLEVPGYVNPSVSAVPSQPIDLYGLMNLVPPQKGKLATRSKNPYELMMEGTDPFAGLIPDVAPLQTNLATIKPLDDAAGLFHSQDGFGKYGYSTILGAGDNENRYAQNFRNDNPNKFYSGANPFKLAYRGLYWGGAFLEKTLESAVVKTGQGLAGLYGMTIGNAIDSLFGKSYDGFEDWISSSTDNVFSNVFNNWDENLKERYHYFQEKSDRERKGFVQSLGDGDFWLNDISDGLGFLASAMLEVGLISKLNLGTKVASRLAPLADGVSTEALGAQAVTTGAGVRTGFQRALNTLGIEGSGHAFVKNAVDLTTQTLAVTAIESAVEAQEVKDRVLQSFEGKVNPETGFYYTEEEKQRLAAAAAAETFKQNMTILIGPKFLEVLVFNRIGQYAKGLFNKASGKIDDASGRASGRVRSRLGNLSSGTSYDKASALANTLKVGSLAGLGFLSEGLFEENIQLAISRTAEDTFGGDDEFYRPGTSEEEVDRLQETDEIFGNVGRRYFRQTRQFFQGVADDNFIDDELSKSIGIGGLFGVVGGAVHGTIGVRQQAKIDNYWNTRLNAATNNLFESQAFYQTRTEQRPDPKNPGQTKPVEVIVTDPTTGQPVLDEKKLTNFLNKMNNIQGIMDIIANTEDPNDQNNNSYQNKELNKLARNVMFTQLAMEYVRAGKKELLLSLLSSASQFSDRDVQSLGYEPGMMSEQDKKNMLTRMINMVERLDKVDQWIENNVLDNVSEPRDGKFGIRYSKTQKEKRRAEFEAKKAYLRGLGMQNVLLDSYLDDIAESEVSLGEPTMEILSSVLDEDGVPVQDFSVPLESVTRNFNSRVPALQNQLAVLQKEFAYHWDNILSRERNSPKGQSFSDYAKSLNGRVLTVEQIKAQEALEKINELQAELDDLINQRNAFLNNDKAFHLVDEDGTPIDETSDPNQTYFVAPRNQQTNDQRTIDQIEADKIRRINGVKREEIGIQKRWIDREWKLTAALKEEKVAQERKKTAFSRRMTLSLNAYNNYFQREVLTRDNSLGQRKMKLYNKDESKRVSAKKYTTNEEKLLKAVRIQGKVSTILAEVNGQKLITELQALLNKDLPPTEFTEELRRIIDNYNGRIMIISPQDKTLVDDQINDTQDEYNFVLDLFENLPYDDRFNDTYYDIDQNGNYVIKPEYDSLQDQAQAARSLAQRIEDLRKVRTFLQSIPETIPGDWNNTNIVKKRIADVYTETSDSIINTYNQLSNDGTSEISGDSFSTKQDLDLIEEEINELGQLKIIFQDRDKNDNILSSPEFAGFIDAIDARIATLSKIRDLVRERLSSRLRENQDFLIDTVNNLVEQVGLNFDGTTANPPIKDAIEAIVTTTLFSKLTSTLQDFKELLDKPDQTADDRKNIEDTYWKISGQVAGILDAIQDGSSIPFDSQIATLMSTLEGTALMQKLKNDSYYNDLVNILPVSVLGGLQLLFYQTAFSLVGTSTSGTQFIDDQPSSPIYKFREDYNLRKFLRNVEKDNSRTPDKTDISKDELVEFLQTIIKLQNIKDLQNNVNSTLSLTDQIEKEKQIVQAKIDNKDNKYENLIVPSIQQLFFIRNVASFMRNNNIEGVNDNEIGFRNWIYIQAPGGAGKTQTLGTWFNEISGTTRDRVLATAFTEEAARGIKKALLLGEEGPKNAEEMAAAFRQFVSNKQFDTDVLIIDEFPAIDIGTQVELFKAVNEYTVAKRKAGKEVFKVVALGDTNQLTFADDGSLIPRPGIIVNPQLFNPNKKSPNTSHPGMMNIIPSLTVNFRSNIFAVTSFVDQFRGSNQDTVNAATKVTSSDPTLRSDNVKGVVSIEKGSFTQQLIDYLRRNATSTRTRALIVNESKIAQYKQLLTNAGITIITDPNDELTKGIYVTNVKNVQGFSFDEVFIDLENNDKVLFSGTNNLDYIYNKAMYVAASRARNLIIVTNFPNYENIEDPSISALENKALAELQTKDTEFISQRDLEIEGAKFILGSEYGKSVTTVTPVQATDPVDTPLDQETTEPPDPLEDEDEEAEVEEQQNAEEDDKSKPAVQQATDSQQEVLELIDSEVGIADEPSPEEVITNIEDESEIPPSDAAVNFDGAVNVPAHLLNVIWSKIKDTTVSAFNKKRADIIQLLFPTAQTIKYKISDGDFSIRVPEDYEFQDLRDGDQIILIPFQQSKTSNSPRKFGYAIVTPAIGPDGNIIENTYRTVSVLSDYEIDKFKEVAETKDLFDVITVNEQRAKGAVSIEYLDVSDQNGFMTTSGKVINELKTGTIIHSNPIKYFYNKNKFKELKKAELDDIISKFINNFYRDYINSFPESQRQAELNKIVAFYNNPENAQIIIPTRKDVEGSNPLLKIPPELRTYVRSGRPYLVFRPYHRRSSMQFVALSRRYLNARVHTDVVGPIRSFVDHAKMVREDLKKKGVTNAMGYSKSLSNMMSRLVSEYLKNPNPPNSEYTVNLISTENGARVIKPLTFTMPETIRLYRLYEMYSQPNQDKIEAKTGKEIENLVNVKRSRNYTFEDGETIYGTILSYDPNTKTFIVRDTRTGEESEKSGVISHTGKSFVGQVQQILNDIMNSNGNISSRFASRRGLVGFVTDENRSGNSEFSGYKFMALLGSKTAPVAKSYNDDGTVKEIYGDVIEILEDLFNLVAKDELAAKKLNYLDEEGNTQSLEVKFRVPVSLNARNDAGELEHDYTNSPQNTSRYLAVSNAKYFESNFIDVAPTTVYATFTGEEVTEEVTESQEVEEVTGIPDTIDVQVPEATPIDELTRDEINTLPFTEIRNRLTPAQSTSLDEYAKREGFKGIDHFFEVIESNHPEEQAEFRDYIIECLL